MFLFTQIQRCTFIKTMLPQANTLLWLPSLYAPLQNRLNTLHLSSVLQNTLFKTCTYQLYYKSHSSKPGTYQLYQKRLFKTFHKSSNTKLNRKKVISFLLSLQAFLCVPQQSRTLCLWFCDTYLWCLRTPSQNLLWHHTSGLQISKKVYKEDIND